MLGHVLQLARPLLGRGRSPEGANQADAGVLTARRGHARPFGASVWADGVNFAVFSRHAQSVALVLFTEDASEPFTELPLDPHTNRTGDVWHVFVENLPAGVLYGFRVNGPFAPRLGHRFSSRAILLDPYARQLGTLPSNGRAGQLRLGKVVCEGFDWEDDRPPRTPIEQTVIYELHVRGYTMHPSSDVQKPGTFLGLCEKIAHLKALGVTAVQLMPTLEFEDSEVPRQHPSTGAPLHNYWGYSPLSFFALHEGYASEPGQQAREFKEMVRQFHKAGLEVILDVVFNHTCEGNENGPTLGFRGLDNAVYYLLDKEGRYYNYSGCGNTLNCNHPVVRDMILDSLTELVTEYHVDGFRFDLAAILGRASNGKPMDEPILLQHIAEHPLLSGTKLIAETWDAAGLNLQGKFPTWGRWAELNGAFRDDVRRFVRSESGAAMNVAKRITGSLDLFGDTAKHPYHSVNFITCHDGFTLWDLVSYSKKNNWGNGENNRDGWDDNISFNCGHEGPTKNPGVVSLRQRQVRNFLTILMLSQGVPMLWMGDEFGRTQQGNNNAYCQDNEIGWVHWDLARENAGLTRFTAMLIALRKKHFALNRAQFLARVAWHGVKLETPDWTGESRTLAMELRGGGTARFYVLLNAHWEAQEFALPATEGRWRRLVDTSLPSPDDIVEEMTAVPLTPSTSYLASSRSMVVLMG